MNEYMYTTDELNTKPISLYHHDQVPFPTTEPSCSSQTDASPPPAALDDSQDISSSFAEPWQDVNVATTPAAVATGPVSCDLQDVLLYYRSQPELLRLILLSKVEEDKRRTEEAKLRAKELDLLLLQQQQQLVANAAMGLATPESMLSQGGAEPMYIPSSIGNHNNSQGQQRTRQTSTDHTSPHNASRRDSALGSSLGGSDEACDEPSAFSPSASLSSSSTPTSFMPMTSYASPIVTFGKTDMIDNSMQIEQHHDTTSSDGNSTPVTKPQPRRRREMQAITKIVETREYPYLDGYFWKNNGNTVQKKTGNKSIYYKCSNSSKGCPVNKTVTWKENGEYLIKYRGEHLPECGKVQRIVDI